MRAVIVDDLLAAVETVMPFENHRTDPDFLELCARIQGREVELVFTAGDAFEKDDNSYWLPDNCWEEVTK